MKAPLFRLTAVSAALAGAYGFAQAQDDAAALTKPESEISVGAGWWSDNRPRMGTYDGMREDGGYLLLDALINRRDDATGTWFGIEARNLGLDTREVRVDWLRQGNIGAFLEYGRTPRDEPYTVRTAVQGIGTSTLRVPTPSATSLNDVQLGTVRDTWTAGVSKNFGSRYDLRVSFRNEDKEGTRLWGRGGAAEFAAEPIDSNTKMLEAVLAYNDGPFQVQGGYYGSWFSNSVKLVDTALTNNTNPFFLSQPLDNEAHQYFVNGGYNFSDRTRGTFKVSYTRATQNEAIPVGPGVPTFAGAPASLNGRLDNTLMQVGINSRATNQFSWLASLRSYESDEKTPQVRIVQTGTPAAPPCPAATCVDNTPLTIKTLTGKLEGTYRMPQNWSLTGGVDLSKQDRNVPAGSIDPATGVDDQRYVPWRSEVEETTFRIEARRSLSETVNGRLALAHSKRDGSEYTRTNEPQSDLINPLHIADRDRNKAKLMVDWMASEPLTVTFNVEYAKDEYALSAARPYAISDGNAATYSIDAAYTISEAWTLNAWYTRDQTEATQRGQRNASGGAGEAVKEARLEDVGDTFGVGLRGQLMARLKAGLDFLYSKNVNRYPEAITLTGAGTTFPSSSGVTAGPLPDITNKLTRINVHAIYALQKGAELRFDYIHERWQTDDWSWLFANGTPFTYGTTTDGTQVVQASKQNADFLGVRYIYRFQ
jgi:MtrB/PioB family decaheme-associated outer membrane protein